MVSHCRCSQVTTALVPSGDTSAWSPVGQKLDSGVSKGRFPSGRSRNRSVSLPCLASRGHPCSFVGAASSICRARSPAPLCACLHLHASLWPPASTSEDPRDHTGARPDKPGQPPISSLIQLHLQSLFATGGYRGLRHSPFRGCGSADQGRSKRAGKTLPAHRSAASSTDAEPTAALSLDLPRDPQSPHTGQGLEAWEPRMGL